uniref:C2H2-type domain-containing protein n=1 Tax=Timema douglasi TaxID=61478 RepID=A0A7R8Z9Q1_TIMDO|nr:unnamed protein product [Timema douglasi]
MLYLNALTDLANVLDLFFKGLSECGLLTTYSVQLQAISIDFGLQGKFRCLVHQFIKSLQSSGQPEDVLRISHMLGAKYGDGHWAGFMLNPRIRPRRLGVWIEGRNKYMKVECVDQKEGNLLLKIPSTHENGHPNTLVQTSLEDSVRDAKEGDSSPVRTAQHPGVSESLGSLVEACVSAESETPPPWCGIEETCKADMTSSFIAQAATSLGTADIIVTCHPATLAAYNFVTNTASIIGNGSIKVELLGTCEEISSDENKPSPACPVRFVPLDKNVSFSSLEEKESSALPTKASSQLPANILTKSNADEREHIAFENSDEGARSLDELAPDETTDVTHVVVETKQTSEDLDESDSGSRMGCDTTASFVCDFCQKTFETAVLLESHMTIHQNKGQCDLCPQKFSSVQGLQEHCREEHYGTGCFTCTACGRRFMTKFSYKRHARTHGGKKGAVCDLANALVVLSSTAEDGEIEMCGKAFSRPDYLQIHYMTHSGVRPLQCTSCPKRFVTSSQLRTHEKTHNGLREHVCYICNKGFIRTDKLKDHMLRHLNIKRHQCSVCKRDYAEKRDLARHFKVHAS